MSADKDVLDNVLSLSMQLNRQAFARPPVEGWLNSFLSMLYERFASDSVQGLQVAQVIGNEAVQMAQAGSAAVSGHYTLEESSPIAIALRTRQMVAAPDTRVFPLVAGDNAIGVLIVYTTKSDSALDTAFGTFALRAGVGPTPTVKTA